MTDKTRVFNCDCMIGMKEFPDKYFDLAIVDPPYGIDGGSNVTLRRYDDKRPNREYFDELIRVSKFAIIWGGNYMSDLIPFNSAHTIIWDKENGESFMSDAEIAFTNFPKQSTRMYRKFWMSNMMDKRDKPIIHINQKPINLYKWLLKNYAKEGDKILDTHGGSMSSVIACLDMGYSITCYEMDTDYYNQAKNRITNHLNQLNAFRPAYDIEFHDNSGVSRLRNQQGVGHQKQKDSENTESIHRIDGLFHGDTTQQCDEKSKAASGT